MLKPSKPILRVGKLKRSGRHSLTAVDNHLSRTAPTKNADPTRTGQNVWTVGGPGQLQERVFSIIRKAGIDETTLRKDATLANDLILTVSPQWFRPNDPDNSGTWEVDKVEILKREVRAFVREQFGPRCASELLHLDESSPHFHVSIVPIIKNPDGTHRLCGRDYFNPERLEQLQDAWEARLKPFGVDCREKGSKATHTTIKRYYSALNAVPAPEIEPPSAPPLKAMLPTDSGREAMSNWQKDEVKKTKKKLRPLEAAAAQGLLYEAEKQAGNVLREQLSEHQKLISQMRIELSKTKESLSVSKDQVSFLRGVSVHEVAAVLGYTGEIRHKENSIDLVKRIGDLTFEEATRWLAQAFNPAVAGAAIAQHTANVLLPIEKPVLTKADKVKHAAISQQLEGMSANRYRLTAVFDNENENYGINFCKNKVTGEEVLWTKEQILFSIPNLTAHNARGGNLYITPIDKYSHFALIDDLSKDGLDKIRSEGYSPSVIIETSPGNHQALVTISKTVSEQAANEWFKAINRKHGDPKITSLEHSMRLAGFQNRKPKHKKPDGNYPFVTIVEVARGFCKQARAVITAMAMQLQNSEVERAPSKKTSFFS